MNPTIIFIHGMFLTGKCWEQWLNFSEQRGFPAVAPDWPLRDGDPADLRASIPSGLGEIDLDTLVEIFARHAAAEPTPPILVGHSLGGLIAQKLVARNLASAAVGISSVAPNAMLSADWDFLKNSARIANPLKGDDPFLMTEEGFYATFTNAVTKDESARAYHRYAVHESRKVLRDAMGKEGRVDLARPHAPLLFVSGDHDRIIPSKLNRKNADAYTDKSSVTDFIEFPGRGHFICGEPGWQEVTSTVFDWLDRTVGPNVAPRDEAARREIH